MPDDSPAPKRRRRAVAAVDKPGAVEAAPPAKSECENCVRLARLTLEHLKLERELRDARQAIDALRRR